MTMPAVPVADAVTIAAMADDFERRFRQLHAEPFRPSDTPIAWIALAVTYLRFSDENSNPRSLDQQLLNVLNRARRDGVFVPWQYVLADAAVSGTLACRTGYTLAKTIVERRDKFGVTWFLIDDLSRLSRNTIESLRLGELAGETGVRVIGASDGFDSANPQSSLLLPVLGSMNEAFVTQLRSKVKRGMDDAFRRGDNIQPPGVGYRLVDVTDAHGDLVITHKGTIEKRAEIDPEAAVWIVRGAEMIAREGKSPIELARPFNEQKVGGRQTWSDNMIRKLYSRERLVGREVFRTTRQEKNRTTGTVRYVKLPLDQWLVREAPHLPILPDELADAVRAKLNLAAQSFGRTAKDRTKKAHRFDLYPKVLIRPICGGCEMPMILGRSLGKYQSFCCFNALHGIHGCTNRGYKSARIIGEAVLGTVLATLFTDDFLADLTADVNKRLAWIARQPLPSTKKLEQEIANEDRQLKRLTDRLAKLDDTHLDAVLAKAEEMGRQRRLGPPRPSFRSPTTAGKPQESCAKPGPKVDFVRKGCYFFLHGRSSEVVRIARRKNPRRPPASGPGMRRCAVGFSRSRKPKGHRCCPAQACSCGVDPPAGPRGLRLPKRAPAARSALTAARSGGESDRRPRPRPPAASRCVCRQHPWPDGAGAGEGGVSHRRPQSHRHRRWHDHPTAAHDSAQHGTFRPTERSSDSGVSGTRPRSRNARAAHTSEAHAPCGGTTKASR
jgi:DNA invertase Pin-like site-specific DNA recombinase